MKLLKSLSSKGFSHIEALVIVLALVIIGGVYALVAHPHALPCYEASNGQCVKIEDYSQTISTSKTYTNLDNVNFGGTSFDPEACVINGEVATYFSVPVLAGKKTVDRYTIPVQVREALQIEDVDTGTTVSNSLPIVIVKPGSGYNPLAIYQTRMTEPGKTINGKIMTDDGWYFTSKKSSADKFKFTLLPSEQFRIGVEGYLTVKTSTGSKRQLVQTWSKWQNIAGKSAVSSCT